MTNRKEHLLYSNMLVSRRVVPFSSSTIVVVVVFPSKSIIIFDLTFDTTIRIFEH